MKVFKNKEVWFVTGSQHLYGKETLNKVNEDSSAIAAALDKDSEIPVKIVFKPVVTTPSAIDAVCAAANDNADCVGIITWMHTFSPAKMWIRGLSVLNKPLLHFHTQFNRDIPWNEIDMDFMNLNQSAHGGREFGFISTRMRINRKVVAGHWQNRESVRRIGVWIRAAVAFADAATMKVARFGDNMRDVAVTEGNKVSAQIKMNYSVYGYGVGDLVKVVNAVTDAEIEKLLEVYKSEYNVQAGAIGSEKLREAARIEIGMEKFLSDGGFSAFTTTFEDLNGLPQLPGIAVQRLMAKGYGFGAEGDWKTAALVRSMKVMASGLGGGTSFMEDYTYNLDPQNSTVLGAHMLEVCPSVSMEKPRLEIHPLSIGGKDDPPRLVFKAGPGSALNASLIDLGNRFRMLVNEVEVVECPDMPKLPVASVLWKPLPSLETAAEAWILAGGAHHTGFSQALTAEHIEDFANIMGIEYLSIGKETTVSSFMDKMKLNDIYYWLNRGLY
ncbi:MAG: L-arabinose isomerase [Bacteroidales bacterium]|nr:L-arabinose isomerase [Bacteroidales bacterium]